MHLSEARCMGLTLQASHDDFLTGTKRKLWIQEILGFKQYVVTPKGIDKLSDLSLQNSDYSGQLHFAQERKIL